MKTQEIKELLIGVITNLESPRPQQWSESWIAKLKEIVETLPKPCLARTHDPYFDDTEPLVEALGAIQDCSSDFYNEERDVRFGKIFNIACKAMGGVRRIEPNND